MSSWKELKEQRTHHYNNRVHGWKLRRCGACYGSGHYDHNGSPTCSSCNGTGRERYESLTALETMTIPPGCCRDRIKAFLTAREEYIKASEHSYPHKEAAAVTKAWDALTLQEMKLLSY